MSTVHRLETCLNEYMNEDLRQEDSEQRLTDAWCAFRRGYDRENERLSDEVIELEESRDATKELIKAVQTQLRETEKENTKLRTRVDFLVAELG